MRRALVFAVFTCFTLMGVSVTAAPITTITDFTSGAWAGADGTSSHTVAGVTMESHGLLGPTLTYNSGAGIGIRSLLDLEPDEINWPEWAKISWGTTVALNSFTVGKLFPERTFLRRDYNEVGQYSTDHGVSWTAFSATSPTGHLTVNLGAVMTDALYLRAPLLLSPLFRNDDFSVRQVTHTSVPEPASLVLLGAGLLATGYTVRRRRR